MMVYRQTEATLDRLAKRRIDIMLAAIEHAQVHGLNEFNVNQVAKYARVAIGTVYIHYVNSDELVASLIAHCAQEDSRALRDACEKVTDPMARLARALQKFITIYTSTRKLHPSLMAREGYRRTIVRTLTDIIASYERKHDPEMLALAIVGALHSVLQSQTNPSRSRLTAILETALRIADVTPDTYQARAKENA